MAFQDEFLKPFKYGWKREIVKSFQANDKFRKCVYYRSPEGKRVRSGPEVESYLKERNITELSKDNFKFVPHTLYKEPYETETWVDSTSVKKRKNGQSTPSSTSTESAGSKNSPKPTNSGNFTPSGVSPKPTTSSNTTQFTSPPQPSRVPNAALGNPTKPLAIPGSHASWRPLNSAFPPSQSSVLFAPPVIPPGGNGRPHLIPTVLPTRPSLASQTFVPGPATSQQSVVPGLNSGQIPSVCPPHPVPARVHNNPSNIPEAKPVHTQASKPKSSTLQVQDTATSSGMSGLPPNKNLQHLLLNTLFSSENIPNTTHQHTGESSNNVALGNTGGSSRDASTTENGTGNNCGDTNSAPVVMAPVSPDSTVIKTEPDCPTVRDPVMESLSMKAVSNTEAEDVKPNIKTEPDSYTVDQIAMMKAYGIEMSQQVVQVKEEPGEVVSGSSSLQVTSSVSTTATASVQGTICDSASQNTTQSTIQDNCRVMVPDRVCSKQQPPVPQMLLENKSHRSASTASSTGVYIDVAEDPLMSRQAKDFYGLTDDHGTEAGDFSDSSSPDASEMDTSPQLTSPNQATAPSSKASGSGSTSPSTVSSKSAQKKPVVGGTKKRTPAQERIWKKMKQNKKGKMAAPPPQPKPTENQEVYICHLCPQSFTGSNAEPSMKRHLWMKHHVYLCDCGETFRKKELLEEHRKTCTGEVTFFKCSECSEDSFRTVEDVIQHVKNDHPRAGSKKATFKCQQCSAKPFDNFTSLKNHMSAKHKKSADQLCSICGELLSTKFRANLHMLNRHLKGKPFVCDKCQTVFFRYDSYITHGCADSSNSNTGKAKEKTSETSAPVTEESTLDRTSGAGTDEAEESREYKVWDLTPTYRKSTGGSLLMQSDLKRLKGQSKIIKTFQCFGCKGRGFSNVYNLIKHIEGRHSRLTPHMTCACGRRVNSIQAMQKHREKCHQKAVQTVKKRKRVESDTSDEELKDSDAVSQCPLCDRTFTCGSSLKKHVAMVHREKEDEVHKCSVCDKTFNSMQSLKKHIVMMGKSGGHNKVSKDVDSHTAKEAVEDMLKCQVCGKKFSSEVAHRKHMSLYHKEKKFRCPCGLQFKNYIGLYRHRQCCKGGAAKKKWVHKCNICGKSFSNSGNTQRHIQYVHHKSWKVCSCGEKFDMQQEYIIHKKVCNHQTDISCEVCDQIFQRMSNLSRHMRMKHGQSFKGRDKSDVVTKAAKQEKEVVRSKVRDMSWRVCGCGKNFDSNLDFFTHRKNCNRRVKNTDFQCKICFRHLANENGLRRHLLSQHNMGKELVCLCGKKFTRQPVFYAHRKTCKRKVERCDKCDRQFHSHIGLQRHQKIVHGQDMMAVEMGPNTCECRKVFDSKEELDKHRKTCSAKLTKCPICARVFLYSWNMNRHLLKNHHIGKKLTCPKCGERFTCHSTWLHHRRLCEEKSAAEMQQPGDEENLVCVCGKRYKRRYMYNLHTKMCGEMRKALRQEVTTQEAQEQEKSGESDTVSSTTVKSPSQHSKTCPQCNMRFVHNSSLEDHLWAVHKLGKPLRCNTCQKEFRYKRNLAQHQEGCSKKNRKNKELATLLSDAVNSFNSPDQKIAMGRRKAAVVGKAKLKKCINQEGSSLVEEDADDDDYAEGSMDYMDYEETAGEDKSETNDSKSSSSAQKTNRRSSCNNKPNDADGGLSKEEIASLFKNVNLQKLCLKPYIKCQRLKLHMINKWVKTTTENTEENQSRSAQLSKSGKKKIKFKQAAQPNKESSSKPNSLQTIQDSEEDNDSPIQNIDSDSSDGMTEKIDIVEDSDAESEKAMTKQEVVHFSSREVTLQLPIHLLRSLNKCSHPETRTLYIGTSTRNEWIKVVGKTSNTFLYQCYYCTEAKQEPKYVATHMTSNHAELKELVQMGNTTKSHIFISCRHCDFISMQSRLFWYHFKYEHGVNQLLVPQSVEDIQQFRKEQPQQTKDSSQYTCAVQLCEFSTSDDVDIMCHMFECHRYSDHIKEGFIRTLRSRQQDSDQSDEAYICTICRFLTYQAFLMDLHCFECHAQKLLLYVCDVCGEQFLSKDHAVLESHMKDKHQQVKVKVSVTLIDSSGKEDATLCKNRPEGKTGKTVLNEQQTSKKSPAAQYKYRPGPMSFKNRTQTSSVGMSSTESDNVSKANKTQNTESSTTQSQAADRSEAVSSTTHWGEGHTREAACSAVSSTAKDSLNLPDIVCKQRQNLQAVGNSQVCQSSKSIACGADMPLSMDCEDEEGNALEQEKVINIRPVNQTAFTSGDRTNNSQSANKRVGSVQSGLISGSSEVGAGSKSAPREQAAAAVTRPAPKPIEIVISDSDDEVEIVMVDHKGCTTEKSSIVKDGASCQNVQNSAQTVTPLSRQRPPLGLPVSQKGLYGPQQVWQTGINQPLVQQVQPLVQQTTAQKQVLGPSPSLQHVLGGSFPGSNPPLVMQITQPPQPQNATAVAGTQQLTSNTSIGSHTIPQSVNAASNTPLGLSNNFNVVSTTIGNSLASSVSGVQLIATNPGMSINQVTQQPYNANSTQVGLGNNYGIMSATSGSNPSMGATPNSQEVTSAVVLGHGPLSASGSNTVLGNMPGVAMNPINPQSVTAMQTSAVPNVALMTPLGTPQAANARLQTMSTQAPPVALQGLCLVNIPPGGSLADISKLQIHPLVPQPGGTEHMGPAAVGLSGSQVNTTKPNQPHGVGNQNTTSNMQQPFRTTISSTNPTILQSSNTNMLGLGRAQPVAQNITGQLSVVQASNKHLTALQSVGAASVVTTQSTSAPVPHQMPFPPGLPPVVAPPQASVVVQPNIISAKPTVPQIQQGSNNVQVAIPLKLSASVVTAMSQPAVSNTLQQVACNTRIPPNVGLTVTKLPNINNRKTMRNILGMAQSPSSVTTEVGITTDTQIPSSVQGGNNASSILTRDELTIPTVGHASTSVTPSKVTAKAGLGNESETLATIQTRNSPTVSSIKMKPGNTQDLMDSRVESVTNPEAAEMLNQPEVVLESLGMQQSVSAVESHEGVEAAEFPGDATRGIVQDGTPVGTMRQEPDTVTGGVSVPTASNTPAKEGTSTDQQSTKETVGSTIIPYSLEQSTENPGSVVAGTDGKLVHTRLTAPSQKSQNNTVIREEPRSFSSAFEKFISGDS